MKTFIVAELSANHGHDINIAKESIKKAKDIGCDAVKIQTSKPEYITLDCDNDYFKVDTGTLWDGRTLFDLYSETYLPWEWHKELFEYAASLGIILFSSPFDKHAVDLLEACNNPIYKIASFEITDIPLIKYVASKGKPVIISTGIATMDEIKEAIQACCDEGNRDITILKCTSEYPAKHADINLRTMVDMRDRFDVKVGLSDHTSDDMASIAATALGACVIEKHFILDKKIGGPDASFSMEPKPFENMIKKIRDTEDLLGKVDYSLNKKKSKSRKYARSLFVVQNVKIGDLVSEENVRSIRPSDGMPPKQLQNIIGKKFVKDIARGTPARADMFK